ncbi:MAG: DUF1489 family protein [Alphaproteobacteria bacterium]|nr:DUF1489 family protein [Alphaproteobacteria bacterium]
MPLHLIKLSVGTESLEGFAAWQTERLKRLRAKDKRAQLFHLTRQTPKRREEILAGGSIFWVIKGFILARQSILDLRAQPDSNGVPHCAIVYSSKLQPVVPRARGPFQGWRYLKAEDAPEDLAGGTRAMPADLRRTLADLGLL